MRPIRQTATRSSLPMVLAAIATPHCWLLSAKLSVCRAIRFCAVTCLSGRSGKLALPFPGNAKGDREGLRNAVSAIRNQVSGKIYLGGHSYGGRQASMLCAEESDLVSGLLLLSYPLHPPRKPEQLRIQHLPNLRTPALFIHGTRDPFGTTEEIGKALELIPGNTRLVEVEGAGHDLGFKAKTLYQELPVRIADAFQNFFREGI